MMIIKKRQPIYNILLVAFAASIFLFTTCMTVDEDFLNPKLTIIDKAVALFEKDEGSKTLKIEVNRDWIVKIESDAHWIDVSPMSGSKEITELTINVKSNDGMPREGSFKIIASSIEKSITITQKGEDASSIEYTTIKDIRAMYSAHNQNEWTIAEPLFLKAVVISDRDAANRPSKRDGFIQDQTGNGIAFRVIQAETPYELGDELSINLEGSKVLYFEYGGVLQIIFSKINVKVVTQNAPITPTEHTIEEIFDGVHDGTLVKLNDVQFKDYEGLKYYGGEGGYTNRILESCNGANINVKTTKNASFKNDGLPAGMGSLVAIASLCKGTWELLIRNLDDVKEISNDELSRCEKEEHPATESIITIDKDEIYFENDGGEETINIIANVNWTAKSDGAWLSISPNSGSSDGVITATTSKNNAEERNATITITDGKVLKSLEVTQFSNKESGNIAADLFFSEYVEGSSYNKYLEIYNGTGESVDLSDYKVELYVNGQTTAKSSETLKGILENGQVIVLKHGKATIYDGIAISSSTINYNGNDAIALIKISTDTYVDIFGTIGQDPGSTWMGSLTDFVLSTKDKTLVRKPSIRSGVNKNPQKGFPALSFEWIGYPVDTADYLGSHTMN